MKKILSLLLCFVVAISAVGCGENNDSSDNTNNSSVVGNSDTSSSAENSEESSESVSETVEIFGFTYDIDTTTDLRFDFMTLGTSIPSFKDAVKTEESAQQAFDDTIEAIKKLKNLEAIGFINGDEFLKYIDFSFLEELPKLKVLDLHGNTTLPDDKFIGELTNLEMLNLEGVQLSDVNLLANLTNLKEIALPYIKGFDTYSWLKENLPNCKDVGSALSYKFQNRVGIDN